MVYVSCVAMVIVDKTPLGPVHVSTTFTLVSTLPDSVAVQVRVTLRLKKRIPLGSRLVLRDGDSTNQERTQTKLIFERNCVQSVYVTARLFTVDLFVNRSTGL